MKHSYICYAAVSEDGESIFEHRVEGDQEWFDEWQFGHQTGLELVPDCSYMEGWQGILQDDLNHQNIDAQIKKYKITVEELADSD